jgi:hypothetical protein
VLFAPGLAKLAAAQSAIAAMALQKTHCLAEISPVWAETLSSPCRRSYPGRLYV